MPKNVSVENNFIGGYKTEYTGLNFPENACTQADNVVFTIVGDVVRRSGFNFEANGNYISFINFINNQSSQIPIASAGGLSA